MKIYLASQSPRRRELLEQMDVEFDILPMDVPEIVAPDETSEAYSRRITKEKLDAAWKTVLEDQLKPMPVLCADTEVVLDGVILGKPIDEDDAFNMIKRYSGKTHEVITSVGLTFYDYQTIQMNKTFVTFSNITDSEIRHYLKTGNYKGKSGAYGIQSTIGQFISRIDGCFYSVMGLPLNTVREMLLGLKTYLLQKNTKNRNVKIIF